ncbi:MAG: hypothetical protein PUB37_03235 [Firmicutes bacterium]|nr:hypothetical protein [Bacillota bacterium]
MKKSFKINFAALIAAMACIFCLCSCGEEEMPKRLDGMYSSEASEDVGSDQDTSSRQTSSDSPADTAEYSVPGFKSGNYTMSSTSTYEQYIYSGKSIVSMIKTSQTYTYSIKLTVNKNGSMSAVYKFARIQTSYEGSDTVTMDTNDKSGNTGENTPYYDLTGQSFTVNISSDFKLSISGIDKIHKKFPDTAEIISDDNMLEIAADLFYNISGKLKKGSSWKLEQSGITNTYKLSSVNKNSLMIDIIGGKLTVPDTFTTDSGFTYNYKACNSLSGSLMMNRANRMLQEQSSYQENNGTIEYSGNTYSFTEAVSSVCNISNAK